MKTGIRAMLLALALGTSCQRTTTDGEAPCPDFDPAIVPVANLNTSCYIENSAPGQFKNHVINNTADYNALFSCPPPPIDFSKYTLLIGKTVTTYGNHLVSQQVQQHCPSYTYSVVIQQGVTAVVQPIVYYALVAKLPANAPVAFDVQVLL